MENCGIEAVGYSENYTAGKTRLVRRRPKTSVAVSAAVEVEFEGRRTTGWLEKKVELVSVPL